MSMSISPVLISYFLILSFFLNSYPFFSSDNVLKSTMMSMSLDFCDFVHSQTAHPPIRMKRNLPFISFRMFQLFSVCMSCQYSIYPPLQRVQEFFCVPFPDVPQ